MIEFVPCEVYANETTEASSGPTEPDGDDSEQQTALDRASRILRPQYLPQLPTKGASFDSFQVEPEAGVFGGRVRGCCLWCVAWMDIADLLASFSTTERSCTGHCSKPQASFRLTYQAFTLYLWTRIES